MYRNAASGSSYSNGEARSYTEGVWEQNQAYQRAFQMEDPSTPHPQIPNMAVPVTYHTPQGQYLEVPVTPRTPQVQHVADPVTYHTSPQVQYLEVPVASHAPQVQYVAAPVTHHTPQVQNLALSSGYPVANLPVGTVADPAGQHHGPQYLPSNNRDTPPYTEHDLAINSESLRAAPQSQGHVLYQPVFLEDPVIFFDHGAYSEDPVNEFGIQQMPFELSSTGAALDTESNQPIHHPIEGASAVEANSSGTRENPSEVSEDDGSTAATSIYNIIDLPAPELSISDPAIFPELPQFYENPTIEQIMESEDWSELIGPGFDVIEEPFGGYAPLEQELSPAPSQSIPEATDIASSAAMDSSADISSSTGSSVSAGRSSSAGTSSSAATSPSARIPSSTGTSFHKASDTNLPTAVAINYLGTAQPTSGTLATSSAQDQPEALALDQAGYARGLGFNLPTEPYVSPYSSIPNPGFEVDKVMKGSQPTVGSTQPGGTNEPRASYPNSGTKRKMGPDDEMAGSTASNKRAKGTMREEPISLLSDEEEEAERSVGKKTGNGRGKRMNKHSNHPTAPNKSAPKPSTGPRRRDCRVFEDQAAGRAAWEKRRMATGLPVTTSAPGVPPRVEGGAMEGLAGPTERRMLDPKSRMPANEPLAISESHLAAQAGSRMIVNTGPTYGVQHGVGGEVAGLTTAKRPRAKPKKAANAPSDTSERHVTSKSGSTKRKAGQITAAEDMVPAGAIKRQRAEYQVEGAPAGRSTDTRECQTGPKFAEPELEP